MNVEVFLTSSNVEEDDTRGRTVVVIDVLRACSTIVAALKNGARAVVPVRDMAQAGKIASNMDPSIYLLGGERGGLKIEGYHLGNSPLEYKREIVEGRDVIFNTTNGTLALMRARTADHLLVGCFLNAGRVVEALTEIGKDVTIICAGRQNRISLEDTLCAGLLLYRLWQGTPPEIVTDTAHIAYTQYLQAQQEDGLAIRRSDNARRLIAKGDEADIDFCLQVDAIPILPRYRDSRVLLSENTRQRSTSVS